MTTPTIDDLHEDHGVDALIDWICDQLGEDSGIDAKILVDLGKDGVILIDATVVPNEVGEEREPADMTIGISLPDIYKLRDGKLGVARAVLSGRLRVTGDKRILARLVVLFPELKRYPVVNTGVKLLGGR